MKNLILLTIGSFLISSTALAQTQAVNERPYIEVNGHAERKVVPDEIYLSITIRERESGKDKISVEQQEKEMKEALIAIGINLENLTISDANADYIKVNWSKKDVVSQTEYELKLATADEVGKVMEKLDDLKIHNAYVSRVDHSKMEEFKKEIEIEAIREAKERADYLLTAIGEETGKAIVVTQSNNPVFVTRNDVLQVYDYRGKFGESYDESEKLKNKIEFRKIEITSNIYVKFEIK